MCRSTRRHRQAGFTLIELVIVIAIIGILAAVAIPKFIDLRNEAYIAQVNGVLGGVRAGISVVAAKNQAQTIPQATTFPPNLEATWGSITGGLLSPNGTACVTATPCFELVLQQPLTESNWVQTTATTYTFTNPVTSTATTYTYNTVNGTFQ